LIGQQHRQFRFDLRYRALTGSSRKELQEQVEAGFPYLPPGCRIELDRVAQRIVLENVRTALQLSKRQLVTELQESGDVSLRQFVEAAQIELVDIYRSSGSWTALRRQAGFETRPEGPAEPELLRAVGRLLHVDDPERLAAYRRFVSDPARVQIPDLDERQRRLLAMLRFSLWGVKKGLSLEEALRLTDANPAVAREMLELFDALDECAAHQARPLGLLPEVPLSIHCRYSREEILGAFARIDPEKPFSFQEGVFYDEATRTDCFLVTVEKSEKHYSPETMYRDYPLSPTLFHWESQNITRADSPTGKRYVNHQRDESNVFLFVRERRTTSTNATNSYLFLGPAQYVSHEGEKPMAITWSLREAIPEDFLAETQLVARGA
jgi:hypothetical protein